MPFQIKKIQLHFKSGLLTPLESDTFLSYFFALNFEKIQHIFKKFLDQSSIPFVFSNGMYKDSLPKPFVFVNENKKTFKEALDSELQRKQYKMSTNILLSSENIQKIFNGEYAEPILQSSSDFIKISEHKNLVPRFGKNDCSPFVYPEVSYYKDEYTIYVKIYDAAVFEEFFEVMKYTLLTFGFGAGKSKGYGKVKKCTLESLNSDEEKVFNYLEDLKEKGIFVILNNYKPTVTELENIDLLNSKYTIHTKQAKMLGDKVFKGSLNFIGVGSVLQINHSNLPDILGGYYKTNKSFNFGYLF